MANNYLLAYSEQLATDIELLCQLKLPQPPVKLPESKAAKVQAG